MTATLSVHGIRMITGFILRLKPVNYTIVQNVVSILQQNQPNMVAKYHKVWYNRVLD